MMPYDPMTSSISFNPNIEKKSRFDISLGTEEELVESVKMIAHDHVGK